MWLQLPPTDTTWESDCVTQAPFPSIFSSSILDEFIIRCIGDRVRLSRHIRKQRILYVPLPLVPDYIMSRAENTIHTNLGVHIHTHTPKISQYNLTPSPPSNQTYKTLSHSSDPWYPLLPLVMHYTLLVFPMNDYHRSLTLTTNLHLAFITVLFLLWVLDSPTLWSNVPLASHTLTVSQIILFMIPFYPYIPQCCDPSFRFPYTSTLPLDSPTLRRSHTGRHQRMGQGEVEGHAKGEVRVSQVMSHTAWHTRLAWPELIH